MMRIAALSRGRCGGGAGPGYNPVPSQAACAPMSRFWSPLISQLSPYVPGEQPRQEGWIKLNTNELPWAPSPRVLAAVRAAGDDSLRRYPDPESARLRAGWAASLGLRAGQVFVGNGSDEVLAHCFQALFDPARPVLFPDVTYSFYPAYCRLYRLAWKTVALDAEFRIDPDGYRRANGGVVFANPNAPTGIALEREGVLAILAANPGSVVVVDEAYVDFGTDSSAGLIEEFENLLVVQTLSKSRGLAGLRVGAAFGHPDLIEALRRVKNSFNSYPLDRIAEAAALAALDDRDWFERSCARLAGIRAGLLSGLRALGFAVLPAQANFVLARPPGGDAGRVFESLRRRRILVRHFGSGRTSEYLRITVGTEDECRALLEALRSVL